MSAGDAARGRRAAGSIGAALVLLAAFAITADTIEDADLVTQSRFGEVRFPHLMHAEEMGIECSECHHEAAAAGLDGLHADYFGECQSKCEACHRESDAPLMPQGCSSCHPDGMIAAAAETLSVKVAIHTSCWNCHDSGTGTEATRSCGFCHRGLVSEAEELWTAAGF